jgi:hypothetical protein
MYNSCPSPPKTCQVTTLLSAGTSMGVGGVGCLNDRQNAPNAQRQRVFHRVMLVFVFWAAQLVLA